jgi:hypothetical protein
MPASPAPADPGRDDDLAWLDRDPMTAAEREASLDRLCEQDEGHLEYEYGDFEPFTAEELAEIREAAADELLAVEAATTGRRGPGPARLRADLPRPVLQPRGVSALARGFLPRTDRAVALR